MFSTLLVLLVSTPAPCPTSVQEPAAEQGPVEQPVAGPEELRDFEAARVYAASLETFSLLIHKKGVPVVGWAAQGQALEDGHTLLAASGPFWSVAALAAVEDETLSSLDELVSATIVEWKEKSPKQDITVRSLLDFSSGLDATREAFVGGSVGNRFMHSLTLPSLCAPGECFAYGPGSLFVFGEFLRRKRAGQAESPLAYLERRVLARIGLVPKAWAIDQAYNPLMLYGTNMSVTEWIKFGELVKNKGRWGETQVVKPELMELLYQPSKTNPNMSLGFWTWSGITVVESNQLGIHDPQNKARWEQNAKIFSWVPRDLIFVASQGRRLYVIPSHDLVVARLGGPKGWSDQAFLRILLGVDRKRKEAATAPPPGEQPGQQPDSPRQG